MSPPIYGDGSDIFAKTPSDMQRVWLCQYGDGESDGRFVTDDLDQLGADDSDSCPVCYWDKTYHGCHWMVLVDPESWRLRSDFQVMPNA